MIGLGDQEAGGSGVASTANGSQLPAALRSPLCEDLRAAELGYWGARIRSRLG